MAKTTKKAETSKKTGADLAGACEGEQIAELIDLARRVANGDTAWPNHRAEISAQAEALIAEIERRAFVPEPEGEYVIRCLVWGGVTGSRESLLKSNGTTVIFATREEAEARAKKLNREMNHAFAVANFRYTVEVRR